MSTWAETRRADRDATRTQDRADRAAERDQDRLDAAAAAKRKREDQAAADAAKVKRQAAKDTKKKVRAAWRAQHAVELLIYPLALVSAAVAIPAMAIYGWDVYGNPTGLALPLISELAVWAFSIAILVSRRRHPDRPTVMLTAGMVLFGGVAFGLNFAHGLGDSVLTGLVMAVVSVSGVVAHQLAVASPPRSRAERAEARIARRVARRSARARQIAADHAVVALAADGTTRLVYTPGLYTLTKGRLVPVESTDSAAPVDRWDAALAELTAAGLDPDVPGASTPSVDPIVGSELGGSSGVAVLDSPPPLDSTPAPAPVESAPDRPRTRTRRQMAAAAKRIARKHGKPVSAEQLRRDLKIAPELARELRDQVNAELYPKP